MAPSSTRATSGKKPLSSKMKSKASSNKKASAAEMKKGLRVPKTAGKKALSRETVDLSQDDEPEEEDPPAMYARARACGQLPPVKHETSVHKGDTLKEGVRTPFEDLDSEVEGLFNPFLKESIVRETTQELVGSDKEEEPPSKDLPKFLAMVPSPNKDHEAWRRIGGVAKFQVELIKFILKHNLREQWRSVPSMVASFMGPAFQAWWHAWMGNQLSMKLASHRGC
ncbi:hypothetical protein DACRYDRAFT_104617 [Dacryopinax primogenitus]|uniref:Uncharacterized protein n=1 Tax=Dacryopinax primogenitus (strain DJM 731) TaxID=1858805 RepID=M5GDR2_DACPD|nr:uncharacterized protein DACRYDRAFT_104617 [Dacryopinax primogenitus]EJU04742.1 hypothetical protein DACRYDRAFT_104617 [Dacryopinax primogenitus]